ncbi:hypothetical protein SLEP1_g48210 [Rubroshorea leprosula]|uniref:Autophagy-related protein n=1 Tax=Rubroshorea leprosula TaxID=152421 RepID=A0AAV5LTV1_9ROSI|nr:hypothetical protein SLEP1_g48210 [Rubroshorea leprosula]
MGKIPSFKEEFTFEQRLQESRDIVAKYPNRVPVIVEKFSRTDLPNMEKKKLDAIRLVAFRVVSNLVTLARSRDV